MKTYFCNDCEVLQSSERPAEPARSMCIAIDSDAAHEISSALRACAGIPDPEVTIPALVEALRDNLALARIKFGNLDPDANKVFAVAEDLLSKLNPSDT